MCQIIINKLLHKQTKGSMPQSSNMWQPRWSQWPRGTSSWNLMPLKNWLNSQKPLMMNPPLLMKKVVRPPQGTKLMPRQARRRMDTRESTSGGSIVSPWLKTVLPRRIRGSRSILTIGGSLLKKSWDSRCSGWRVTNRARWIYRR